MDSITCIMIEDKIIILIFLVSKKDYDWLVSKLTKIFILWDERDVQSYFHEWTQVSSSREEILKITKILSSLDKVKNDGWLRERFSRFYCEHFYSQTEVAYFCMNNWYSREDFWFQDQEQQLQLTAVNTKYHYRKFEF